MPKPTAFSELAVMSLDEVARRLPMCGFPKLTRARVMQLEHRALKKMAAEAERLGLRRVLLEK